MALWHTEDGLWVCSAETAWYLLLRNQNAGVQGLVSNHVCKLKWALKIGLASENWIGEDSSPPSAHISGGKIYSRFTGRLRVLRLLGCSQQEGVATCLLSVLLQPSCGPTLVDFSEITWHPHCGWLRGGSVSAGLCYGQHGPPPPSPAAFTPCLSRRKRLGWLVFEHTKHIHKHNILIILTSLLLPLGKLTNDWQFTFVIVYFPPLL